MVKGDIITMSNGELKRLHVIHKVIAKEIKQVKAAEILELSTRQLKRIVKRIKQQGDRGIIHQSRGNRSHNAIDEKKKEQVKKIYKRRYEGFGPTLAVEKLLENEKIRISDETLRNWLVEEGWWKARQKCRKHRRWRERRACCGQMIQMDGSHHDWLEGRGPRNVLMGYIDDANNRVYARFYAYEGTIPAMDSFKRYIKKYGLPHSVYLDNHSTYKSQAKARIEDELEGRNPMSEFERALEELSVRVIHAQSAPAKGRVERLFRTLQDRLVKELRLCKVKTVEDANACLEEYLPKFNKQFGVEPREKGDAHRVIPKGIRLDDILCIKTKHPLRNDYTVIHSRKLYQVLDKTHAHHVVVQERIDGRMLIVHNGKGLRYKQIIQRPEEPKIKKKVKPRSHMTSQHTPWRKFKLPGSPNYQD